MNKFLSLPSQFVLTLSLILSTAHAMELDSLDLSHNGPCCSINPFTDEDLARYPHLTSLNLDWNDSITDNSLVHLTSLTELSLRGNRKISDAAVRQLTNLQTLHLGDNYKISDLGLAPLHKLVNIYRVDSMSPQDYQMMRQEATTIEYKRLARENEKFIEESIARSLETHKATKAAIIAETPGWWEGMSEDEAVNCLIKLIKLKSEEKSIKEEGLPIELQEFFVKFFKAVLVGKETPPDNILNRITKYAVEHDPKLLEELEKQRQKSEENSEKDPEEDGTCTIF